MRRLADRHRRRRRRRPQAIEIASPDNPVTWDIADDNQPIADGLSPEAGPLLLYNYADYIGPAVVKAFEEKYGVEVKVSTFNDTDEAITKIRTGAVPFDIYFPSYDQIGRLVTAELVRPLNHSYIGNLGNVWSDASPTPGTTARRATPCPTASTRTGIGWRTDLVPDDVAALDNPYDVALGHRRTAARSRSSTTGTPRWRWWRCAPASPTSTPTTPDDLASIQRAPAPS